MTAHCTRSDCYTFAHTTAWCGKDVITEDPDKGVIDDYIDAVRNVLESGLPLEGDTR